MAGAAYGASAVPSRWRLALQGWPGLTTRGLIQLATKIVDKGLPEDFDRTYGAFVGEGTATCPTSARREGMPGRRGCAGPYAADR